MISFTKSALPFGWLGNMCGGFPIQYNNKEWRTTEALFQALRFDNSDIQEAIREQQSPMGAKFIAKRSADKMIVVPVSNQDLINMETCLRLKLEQHPQLKKELLSTGDEVIVEDVTARGLRGNNGFWGMAKKGEEWQGENQLGKLWMKIREELKNL